jgi:hypothetical protein
MSNDAEEKQQFTNRWRLKDSTNSSFISQGWIEKHFGLSPLASEDVVQYKQYNIIIVMIIPRRMQSYLYDTSGDMRFCDKIHN